MKEAKKTKFTRDDVYDEVIINLSFIIPKSSVNLAKASFEKDHPWIKFANEEILVASPRIFVCQKADPAYFDKLFEVSAMKEKESEKSSIKIAQDSGILTKTTFASLLEKLGIPAQIYKLASVHFMRLKEAADTLFAKLEDLILKMHFLTKARSISQPWKLAELFNLEVRKSQEKVKKLEDSMARIIYESSLQKKELESKTREKSMIFEEAVLQVKHENELLKMEMNLTVNSLKEQLKMKDSEHEKLLRVKDVEHEKLLRVKDVEHEKQLEKLLKVKDVEHEKLLKVKDAEHEKLLKDKAAEFKLTLEVNGKDFELKLENMKSIHQLSMKDQTLKIELLENALYSYITEISCVQARRMMGLIAREFLTEHLNKQGTEIHCEIYYWQTIGETANKVVYTKDTEYLDEADIFRHMQKCELIVTDPEKVKSSIDNIKFWHSLSSFVYIFGKLKEVPCEDDNMRKNIDQLIKLNYEATGVSKSIVKDFNLITVWQKEEIYKSIFFNNTPFKMKE